MFNRQAYEMGAAPNQIRQIFEYGRQQAKLLGPDKVYDFSLGNPSIPAPDKVNRSIHQLLDTESSIRIHGYTSGVGGDPLREAVAANLSERFGVKARMENVFISCGAAPALQAVLVALRTEKSEIIGIAPYFMEYKAFTEANGSRFVLVPADLEKFQVNIPALAAAVNENTQAVILNSPNNPSGAILTEETIRAVAALLTERAVRTPHLHHRRRALSGTGIRRSEGDLHPNDLPGYHRVLFLVEVTEHAGRAHRIRLCAGGGGGLTRTFPRGGGRGAGQRSHLCAVPDPKGGRGMHRLHAGSGGL